MLFEHKSASIKLVFDNVSGLLKNHCQYCKAQENRAKLNGNFEE